MKIWMQKSDLSYLPPFSRYSTFISENEKSKLQAELDKFKADKSETESQMEKLKVSLYAKFGDQIHLERE